MMTERVAPDADSVRTAALEQAVDAVVVVDAAERIIFCIAAAARLWGCRPARVLGEPLQQHLPGLATAAAASDAVPTAGPSADFPVEPIAVHGVDGGGAATG